MDLNLWLVSMKTCLSLDLMSRHQLNVINIPTHSNSKRCWWSNCIVLFADTARVCIFNKSHFYISDHFYFWWILQMILKLKKIFQLQLHRHLLPLVVQDLSIQGKIAPKVLMLQYWFLVIIHICVIDFSRWYWSHSVSHIFCKRQGKW